MAIDINDLGGWGDAAKGGFDIYNDCAANLEYYGFGAWAAVKSQNGVNLSLTNLKCPSGWEDAYGGSAGPYSEVLIHHSLCRSTNPSPQVIAKLGKFEVRQLVNFAPESTWGDIDITLDQAPDIDLENFYVQVVFIWEMSTAKWASILNADVPSRFTVYGGYGCGGILAFKFNDTLKLGYGKSIYGGDAACDISLVDCGIPAEFADYRPLTPQEQHAIDNQDLYRDADKSPNDNSPFFGDIDPYSGAENSITKDRLLLNVGDGALFLLAKNIVVESSEEFTPCIGNSEFHGVQFCRGAPDSPNLPEGATNIGGSTIFIACESFSGFTPKLISKYRSADSTAGKGLARCFIACKNPPNSLLADEGLYALDTLHDANQLSALGINSFGNGSDGNFSAADQLINSYASVTVINNKVCTVSFGVAGRTLFNVGTRVLIHQIRKSSADDYLDGKFLFAKIVSINGSTITLDQAFDTNLDDYYVQLVTVPQFENWTLAASYSETPAWNNGCGGIYVVACNDTLDLSDGQINVEAKGTRLSAVNKT